MMGINRWWRLALALTVLGVMGGCNLYDEDEAAKAGKQGVTPPVPAKPTPPPAPTPTATPGVQELRVKAEPPRPIMPLSTLLNAFTIADASQMQPGELARGFIGDAVLENSQARFVIAKPNPAKDKAGPQGGSVIDVSQQKDRLDYIESVRGVPDLESTTTQFVYETMTQPMVVGNTTATVVLRGYIGIKPDDPASTEPLRRMAKVGVTTVYSLGRNDNKLAMTTYLVNASTETVSLLPGDIADWGLATTFVEGTGILGGATETSASSVLAFADDFSVGIVNGGGRPVEGIMAPRIAIVRQYGSGPFNSPMVERKPARGEMSAIEKDLMEEEQRRQRIRTAPPPAGALTRPGGPTGLTAPPSPETNFNPTVAPPRPETNFNPPVAPPRPETNFNPPIAPPRPETNFNPPVIPPRPETNFNPPVPRREGAKGGDGENRESTASATSAVDLTSAPASAVTSSSIITASPATSATQAIPKTDRLVLAPGKSYEFTRHLVVSDGDFSRVSDFALESRNVPMGAIGGGVLEYQTGLPIADAEVRISGGPNWSGTPASRPSAFIKAKTRADGTYVVRLPAGKYVLNPFKTGRRPMGQTQIVEVRAGTGPQVVPLLLSRESIVTVAVCDPEMPTSAPLPCKVTLISKPGSPIIDWGPGLDASKGVRNVYYLPLGAAQMPVTPGRYQLVVSRGIEYDIIRQDLDVQPEKEQTFRFTLPRALKTPGMVSMDVGVMTTASAVGALDPRDAVVMAACEGVSLLVTGDYDKATDLQPQIEKLDSPGNKFSKWVRAFRGMRFLAGKDNHFAEVLVYPVTDDVMTSLTAFRKQEAGMPADVFLADLRRELPGLVIEVANPLDLRSGYLAALPFDDNKMRYERSDVPPPDFDAIRVMENGSLDYFNGMGPRYDDLQRYRLRPDSGGTPIAALGGSSARLPFSQEIGYPRIYIRTIRDTPERVKPEDIVTAIKGQHFMVTNGPILKLSVFDPATDSFSKYAGDVVDLQTTDRIRMKLNVTAAPWVDLSGINLNINGESVRKIEVRSLTTPLRYPVHQLPDADVHTQIIESDGFVDALAFSNRRPLSPVVAPHPPDFGGEAFPLAWTGPIFIDQNGDGKIQMPPPKD